MTQTITDVKSKIRDVVDFPKPGIIFRDITTALKEPETLKVKKDYICDEFKDIKNDNKRIKVPTLEEVKLAYERAEKIVSLSKKQNIETIDILHKDFPKKLKLIENAPQVLFYKGNYNAIRDENTLAIIGSREASKEGQKNAYEMAYLFAKENYSIISGLAMGCDTYAHKGCLEANGTTVGA